MADRIKKILLKDIADETGFSVNTVSHALNDKPDISEETKKIIKDTADRMGYIGNASASFLRSGVSRTIAIILGDISNPHFSIMVKEIEKYLKGNGYISFIMNTDENEITEKQAILAALNKNVDGIIICPTPNGAENINFLKNKEIPFVLIGRYFTHIETSYVVCDDVNGGYLAVKCLLELGHRKILFLNGPEKVSSAKERLQGCKKALSEWNIQFDKNIVDEMPITVGKAGEKIEEAVLKHDATAIIAFSDMIAWETIAVLNKLNKRVPQDISVIGFDDIQSKYQFPVMLTSITSSKGTMATKAAEIITQKIAKKATENIKLVLPTKLIIRESTGKCSPAD